MEKGRFKLNDIKIGDMVFFSIRGGENNLQQYWKVVDKDKEGKLKVKVEGRSDDQNLLIDVRDVQIIHSAPAL